MHSAGNKKSSPAPLKRALEQGFAPRAVTPIGRLAVPAASLLALALATTHCAQKTDVQPVSAESVATQTPAKVIVPSAPVALASTVVAPSTSATAKAGAVATPSASVHASAARPRPAPMPALLPNLDHARPGGSEMTVDPIPAASSQL
jgi:hypothetical protein